MKEDGHYCSFLPCKNPLFCTNQNKVLKLRLRRTESIEIKEIDIKWKPRSSPFKRCTFRHIGISISCEISILRGDGNLTGRVSFLRFKLVCLARLFKICASLVVKISSYHSKLNILWEFWKPWHGGVISTKFAENLNFKIKNSVSKPWIEYLMDTNPGIKRGN